MIYHCSGCGRPIGKLLDPAAKDKDGNPLQFYCPHTKQKALLLAPWGVG